MARRCATWPLWLGLILAAAVFPGARLARARESALCEKCSRGCNAQFTGAFKACKTFTCQDEVKVRSRKCFLICAREEAGSSACRQSEMTAGAEASNHRGGRRAAESEHEERLGIRHHERDLEPWRTLAAIAMVAEQLDHKKVDDCEIAGNIDRAAGGGGRCCDDHGAPIEGACNVGLGRRRGNGLIAAYFQSRATDLHRLLTAKELRDSIDGGFPVLAMLQGERAMVVLGYREGGTFLVDDPGAPEQKATQRLSTDQLARAGWVDTWYFRNDAVAGHFAATADAPPPERAPAPAAASKVGLGFPLLKDPATQKFVGARISGYIGALRACYDRALLTGVTLPSPATALLSFAVADGTPTLILVKDSGGLPGVVTSCLSDEVSRWSGLFPGSGDYLKTQEMAVTFTALASAPGNSGALGQVAPR